MARHAGETCPQKESVWETLYRDEGMIGKWRGRATHGAGVFRIAAVREARDGSACYTAFFCEIT
jgi:hypothetical protein